MKRDMTAFVAALAASVLLASCGGGGGASSVPANPGTPTSNASSTQRVTIPSSEQTIALPSAASFAPFMDVYDGDAPNGATLNVSTTLTAPSGLSLPATSVRKTLATGQVRVLFYVTFVAPATVTLAHIPAIRVRVPGASADEQFYYAISDPTQTTAQAVFRTEGPAEFDGTTARFARSLDPITLVGGLQYVLAFYGVRTGDQVLATWSFTALGNAAPGTTTARFKVEATPFDGISAGECLVFENCLYWLTQVLRLDKGYAHTTQLRDVTTTGFTNVVAGLTSSNGFVSMCVGVPSTDKSCSLTATGGTVNSLFFPSGGTFAGNTITMVVTDFGKITFTANASTNRTDVSIPFTIRVYGH